MTRLINADELRENMLYAMCGTGYQHVALSEIDYMPTVDAMPIDFIENEIKNNKGFYNSSLRRLLDAWADREEE